MTTTSDNIAAIEWKAPGLHETEIARLAGSFDVGRHPAWVRVEQDGNGVHGGFYTCAAATETSPAYIRADIAAEFARKAEAMEREIAALREALTPFAAEDAHWPEELGDVPFNFDHIRRARTLLNGGPDAQG